MRTRTLLAAVGALAAACLAAGPAPAAAASPASSCAWYARLDTSGANALFLDGSVTYWVTRIPYVPGETLTLRGQYPHARYFSVTAYDPRTRAVSSLYDAQVQPDPGSVNPFRPGAPRNDPHRAWTVAVDFLAPGQSPSPAPNTLSTGFVPGSTPATDFFLVYRVYLPDRGLDQAGGAPLPSVTANLPVTGSAPIPDCPAGYSPPAAAGDEIANRSAPQLPPDPKTLDPAWHRFYNFPTSAAQSPDSTGHTSFAGQVTPYTMKTGQGGYLEDLENAYLYTFLNQGGGPLTVIQARALTYPSTQLGAPVMPAATDVRYWSLCSYDPASQRELGCAADYQAAPSGGTYTVVVSTPANRPADLCGAAWLPFGPNLQSLLIFRNQLGTSPYTVQGTQLGHETAMGAYYPAARYLDRQGFAQTVCGAGTPAGAADDSGAAFSGDWLGSDGGYGVAGPDSFGGLPPVPSSDADAGSVVDEPAPEFGEVRAAHRALPAPTGNLPLGLAVSALVVVGLAVFVRARVAS